MELNILVGGAAGQGMDTVMNLLGKALVREGFGLVYTKDYMSRVRGGHNFSRLRIAGNTPFSPSELADILIALNEETYHRHQASLSPSGRLIYDPGLFDLPGDETRGVAVALKDLAREAGSPVTANTVAVGALLALMGLEGKPVENLLGESFAGRGELIAQNITALQSGYEAAAGSCGSCFRLPPKQDTGRKLFVAGNQVLGMAALAGGCNFLAAYPMTPSTGIMTYLAGKSSAYGIVVEQAEDEIAAVNMALGASFAGARAMTVTSGGGFSLMVEGLSLAGMTETPLVIVVAMRPGPATGLPTRTEQGDLDFVIHAGHGEFPRAVLSAISHEDAFYRMNKAFQLADRYQGPVIFLSDQHFADMHRSVDPFDFSRLKGDRALADPETVERPYRRYRFTDSGISPRALPGQIPGEVVLADSDEHDENGNIIEDSATRRRMVEKRMRKMAALAAEMDEPELYGDPRAEILLLGWGSTWGALREAVDGLASAGLQATLLHFSDIWPLPRKRLEKILPGAAKTFCVEQNATGQLAGLIRRETGFAVDRLVLKYDGRPFLPREIIREVEQHV